MNELYIANLVKKQEVMNGIYICKTIGPIVGLLLGTHFLSSHSKKYSPMLTQISLLQGTHFYMDLDFSKEPFFSSKEAYAYCELQKVEQYDHLDKMIEEYKKRYDGVSYYMDFTRQNPIMIRYKNKSRGEELCTN